MKKIIYSLLAACFVIVITQARIPRGSGASSSSGVLIMPSVNDVRVNWANAGLAKNGGYPTRSTVCATVTPTNVFTEGGTDDASTIQTAVNSCTAGQVLVLSGGASSTAVVTVASGSNTMTVVSGTIPSKGNAIQGLGFYPGTTVVSACSGSTCTISMPPFMGATVSNETVTVQPQFNFFDDETVTINKQITVRGAGNCNGTYVNATVCQTLVNVWNGAVPEWVMGSINSWCGISSLVATAGSCSSQSAPFLLTTGQNEEWGWGGCGIDQDNPTTSNCGTTLTADAAQGDTTIHVTSTAHFTVGMVVMIDENPQVTNQTDPTWASNTVAASTEWLTNPLTPAVMRLAGGDIAGAYSFVGSGTNGNQRLNQELHKIASIGTNTLTFDDPLSLSFRQSGSHDARVYWPTINNGTIQTFNTLIGLENLAITRSAGNGGGVQVTFCEMCWVKNVESGGWIGGSINVLDAFRTQLDTIYSHLGYNLINSGAEYAFGVSERATETLLVNSIDVFGGKGMVVRGAALNVFIDNYVDMTFYSTLTSGIGDWFQEFGANASHYAGSHHNYFESNWTYNCDADNTHGNATYTTYLRNDCTALRTDFTDPSINMAVSDFNNIGYQVQGGVITNVGTGVLRAGGPMAWNYGFAYVGNVMGTAGKTTTANGWAYAINAEFGPGQANNGIWASGWANGAATNSDPHLIATASPLWEFRSGNYDYLTASIVDSPVGYSPSIPNSLYYASKPAYYTGASCTYSWPWVTPTSSPFIQPNSCSGSGLPAKARWDAGTPFVQP